MEPTITAAMIALVGVILSVSFSLLGSLFQTRLEIRRMRSESAQQITERLLSERLRHYPELYRLLSDFDKQIRFGTAADPSIYNLEDPLPPNAQVTTPLSQDVVQQLLQELLLWDSAHAILLTGNAGGVLHNFRLVLFPIANLDEETFRAQFSEAAALKQLLTEVGIVEHAIRSDLGIFEVEFLDPNKAVYTHENIRDYLQQRNQRKK